MAEPDEPLNVRHLVQAIDFLAALRCQLKVDHEPCSEKIERYGVLVPPDYTPTDLVYTELERLSAESAIRRTAYAGAIDNAIGVLRELLQRHERSRVTHRMLNWYIGAPFLHEENLKSRLYQMGLQSNALHYAIDVARMVHLFEKRDDGADYLEEHVYPLAYEVARYLFIQDPDHSSIEQAVMLALLHDTIEDCGRVEGVDCGDVRRQIESRLGSEILSGVLTLTKLPKSNFAHLPAPDAKRRREEEYFARLKVAPYIVKLVKVLDRINNLLCVHKSPDKIPGYIEETLAFHMPLAAEVDSALVEEMGYVIETLSEKLHESPLHGDQ